MLSKKGKKWQYLRDCQPGQIMEHNHIDGVTKVDAFSQFSGEEYFAMMENNKPCVRRDHCMDIMRSMRIGQGRL